MTEQIDSKSNLLINDWEEAKIFYSCKGGICEQCKPKLPQKKSLILPLGELFKRKCKVDFMELYRSVSQWGKPVFFYHQGNKIAGKIVIKFTGTENFQPAIKTILPFLDRNSMPATIISPYSLTKSNRMKEHKLVALTKRYFEPLGFIKLDLHSVADFHDYAATDNIGLLMLPLKDLPDYIQYAVNLSAHDRLLPAIFQP